MRHLIAGTALLALLAFTPCIARADDEAIAKKIISKLRQAQDAGDIKGFSVDLEVDEGAVWMKGHFSSAAQKAKALKIAQYVPGVTQVVDDLKVKTAKTAKPNSLTKLSTATRNVFKQASTKTSKPAAPRPIASNGGSKATDAQIAKRVITELSKLKDSGQLKNFKIDVDVTDASVWIKGDVASNSQRSLILDKARRVAGVRQVVNDIKVYTAANKAVAQPKAIETVGTAALPSATPTANADAPAATPTRTPIPAGYVLVPVNGFQGQQPIARPQTPFGSRTACSHQPSSILVDRQHARSTRSNAHGWWPGNARCSVRASADAELRMAKLCVVPELRCCSVSEAALSSSMAVHRTVLSLPASPTGMA